MVATIKCGAVITATFEKASCEGNKMAETMAIRKLVAFGACSVHLQRLSKY